MAKRPAGDHGRIRRTVLSEQIKDQLIEDIFRRKYKQGDRIVESALARELGVSQTSVREALRSLIDMGFLESQPFKGITVRSFSEKDLWEVFTVRSALEMLSVQLAVERITDEEIAELETIVDQMVEAGKGGNIARRTTLNIRFHRRLVEASDNKLILKLFDYVHFGTWSLISGNMSKIDPVWIAARHKTLIDALKSRDPERASRAIQEHIAYTGKPAVPET